MSLTDAGLILVTIFGGVITYLLTTQKQIGKCMTREEHEKLCTQKHKDLKEQLDRMEKALGDHVALTGRYRHAMQRSISSIDTRLNVIEDRSRLRRVEDQQIGGPSNELD